MPRTRRALVLVSVLLAAAGVTACASAENAAPAPSVTITRDAAGIPHITAGSFRGLGYGEAWAFAQDNLCTLADDFVTVNGQRSKYFGPTGLANNYSAGASNSNLDSDFFWTSVKDSGLLVKEMHQPPPLGPEPQVLDLYRGFVAGYNAYLASGRLDDPTCKGKPWVRPITLQDLVLRGYQIVTEATSAQFIGDLVKAQPPTAPATAAPAPTASPAGLTQLAGIGAHANAVLGSNGIGLGSQATVNHDGMVLANPHFPWRGTERFWMAQLTVPGQYDVEGGTLMGFPLIGIGFNADLAWTHTVSTSFRFTAYQLKLVPGDPTSYLVDGTAQPMGHRTVVVDTGDGTAEHTFYTTRWGTVVDVGAASYHWTDTTAYALDDSMTNDAFRAANQYLAMGRATSVQKLLEVESHYLAIPTFNTIAADKGGHALYADVGNTPNVPASLIEACVPSGLPQLVYQASGVVTLDGSRSACAWKNDPGTPVPGIFDAAHEPHTIRTDYVENSNDSYWLANPNDPFPAYSPIIGRTGEVQGLRTRLGDRMIEQRIAGTDGYGPPKFTIPTLQAMWQSNQSYEAQLLLDPLVAACRATPSATASDGTVVDLGAACTALAGYDKTGDLDAHGGWLFSQWATFAPSSGLYAVPFDPQHPLTTPSGLNTSNPKVLQALADAVQDLTKHGVPLDASYGQVQHVTRGAATIPIPGCDTGCFNAIYTADSSGGPLAAGAYGEVIDGSSLVMTTELTSRGPVSQGILTYSQATNPSSPWYANMTRLYSQKTWVPLAYTADQLAKEKGNRTLTLTVH